MLSNYLKVVVPTLLQHRNVFDVRDAVRFYIPWLRTMKSRNPLIDALPWMPFPAIRFLQDIIGKDSRVFEYGAGGSSMFFGKRVEELVSVEHDKTWFETTQVAMQDLQRQFGTQWTGILAEAEPHNPPADGSPADPLAYTSADENFSGQTFHRYAEAIDAYPDEYFDVVLIDGRARPSCFLHAMTKVKIGGYVILDNAERDSYAYIEETAEKIGFEKREFWGPGPYNHYCWRTIFLQRSVTNFALNDLDKKLSRYLDFDGGTFIEAGANDGIRQSNSLYFEMKRGWRGVLVEAIPALYEQCRRHRPRAKVVWAALGAPEQVPGTARLRYAGLMSVVKGEMKSADEEDAHILAGCETQKLDTYEVDVPYATLSSVLDQCGISKVDLLSLDVEGMESRVLEGLDFERHAPAYILVEARYRGDIEKALGDRYEVIDVLSHHDILYRLRSGES
jgi:FkbM family methyltransferase